jgi:hypothetical protein
MTLRRLAFFRRRQEEWAKNLAKKSLRCRLCEYFILNCFELCMFLPVLEMRHGFVFVVDDPPPNDGHLPAPMEEEDDDDDDDDEDEDEDKDTLVWWSLHD